MFRENWRDVQFWRWWWRNRAGVGVRVAAGLALLALLLVGGWFGAVFLSAAGADPGSDRSLVLEKTVAQVVTVRQQGKVVRKIVAVVKRVVLPSTAFRTTTQYATRVVTVDGRARVVRQPIVRYVPRVRDRVVTVAGGTRTVSETRVVPTIETETQTRVVTAQRTVTATQVQTTERTVTNTDTQYRTITNTVTQTSPAVTVTTILPVQTVTVAVTITVKH